MQSVRTGIAYVPQVINVFPSLTVRENLEMGAYIRRSGTKERIEQLCEMFPDLRAAIKRPAETSGHACSWPDRERAAARPGT